MVYNRDDDGFLTGHLLVAMPQMLDDRFVKTVIYMCAHTEEGAMGLVVNKILEDIDFPDLLDQLDLNTSTRENDIRIHFGGPVESSRGFVLHSSDYQQDATVVIDEKIALTATTEILRDIAEGEGPNNYLLALGYAGWGPGQLDSEIQSNGWLSVDAAPQLIFSNKPDEAWKGALATIGIDVSMLSGHSGHA
ncbi:MAG: hypothetical protein CFH41_01524 [Alphaproteobacteria bacterium MarineAlpha11_Bin1]|nr:MAG: hypothetical protein CFH41_01524 [Alphaproteobacteria bacterium MarineAlpha11_Bin1]|tara:strand:- start:9215 stop:9790 length:576 start_codon:yes stop_codon:yes gene_type:complete